MTASKRFLDFLAAVILLIILSPLIIWVALRVLINDGRPIIFKSERMKTPDTAFHLWKFRTMTNDENDAGVSGGDKARRITKTGAKLRAKRLDELPQLFNVLKGDISFVGPRPPLRSYVEQFPELYREVLKCRPGITGLATLIYHKHEQGILDACNTAEETDSAYRRRCIPAKARLDRIYAARRTNCYDFKLMCATVFKSISPHQRRKD